MNKVLSPEDVRSAGAGVVSAAAYACEIPVDDKVFNYKFNDLVLLGRPFSSKKAIYMPLGLLLHLSFGGALGMIFGRVQHRLPGPKALKGVGFALAENTSLWSVTPLVDRYHPGRKSGELDRLACWRAYWTSLPRHILFGLLLTLLVPDRKRS